MKSSWTLLTINDVCSVTDCQHKTAPTVDIPTEYRMLRTANIRNGQLRDVNDTKSVTKDTYDKWSVRGYLESRDVILTREAPMGEVALLRDNEKYKYFLGQRMLQLKAYKDVITPEFLYYSLQTRELQHQIMMNEGTGSVVSNIRIPLLKKMKLFVPNLQEQQRITKLLLDIDNKIIVNKEIIDNLEQLAQTFFKHWFTDFEFANEQGKPYKSSGGEMVESELGVIPKDFKVGSIYEIAKVIYGAAFSSKLFNTGEKGLPLIRIRDLKTGTPQFYTDEEHKKATIIHTGDLLIGMDAEFTPTIWKGIESYLNQRVCLVEPFNERIHKMYLYYAIQPYMNFLENAKVGTTVIHLSKKDFDNMQLVIPSADVLNAFYALIDPIYKQMINLFNEIRTLKQHRDILLPKLLTGEIEIPDELEVK